MIPLLTLTAADRDLARESGRTIGRQILFPATRDRAAPSWLTAELAAWATLTVT
jgi:hypothetical protein